MKMYRVFITSYVDVHAADGKAAEDAVQTGILSDDREVTGAILGHATTEHTDEL